MTSLLRALFVLVALAAAAPGAFAEDAPPAPAEATLRLSAVLQGGNAAPLTGGLRWRVYEARAQADGAHALAAESSLAEPTLTLPPGDYVAHVAFGLASAAKRVTLAPGSRSEQLTLSAGGLEIEGVVGDKPIDPSKLSLAIYVPQGRNPEGKLIWSKAKAGQIIGLPEGQYHIVSTVLDAVGPHFAVGATKAATPPAPAPTNSVVNADIKVLSGKVVDVTLRHHCATLTLKLVEKPGEGALANTTFTVLTPGGDVIRELIGAFPSLVLAEGEYVVVARHDARTYQSSFQVQSGLDRDVEVVAQGSAK